ncbi:MAG: hypothetical protein JXA18_08200 [Chitinispirillaceae bacterium]|nr:hypothetical protein [Chitinispirillaceae bacterium]
MKRLNVARSSVFVMLFTITFSSLAAKAPPKPDMFLTLEDGQEVVLHPDSSWDFVKFSFIREEFDDIYMDLTDGRIICLKNDMTWQFVKKRPPLQKAKFDELPNVEVSSSATHKVLDQAVQAARKQVFDKAATRLFNYAKKSKMTRKYLVACIKDEVGEEGAVVSYTKGWTALAKLSLSKVQVDKILDCVIVQVEAGTGTAADTSKKAASGAAAADSAESKHPSKAH